MYGRREKRGREAGFPRWREAGEKGKNYVTLRNISQSEKCKGAGAKKYRAGTGIKGYGKREVRTPPVPPLHYSSFHSFHNHANFSTKCVIFCFCRPASPSSIVCNGTIRC